MGICRLCLQAEGENIKSQNHLELLKTFIPGLYTILRKLKLHLCEICLTNIDTLTVFLNTVKRTNEKIKTAKDATPTIDKIDLIKCVHPNNYDEKDFSACRLCLKIISGAQIFLYDNNSNVLRHDLIVEMLKLCTISVDLKISENPVMCLQCWEDLQICYSFKKDCLDFDTKIKAYCTIFCLAKTDITEHIFKEMCDYFAQNLEEDLIKLSKVIEKEDELLENGLDTSRYSLRKKLKKEDIERYMESHNVSKENKMPTRIPKRRRHYFTQDDDNFLLEAYKDIKNSESNLENYLLKKIWPQIQVKWLESFPDKPLTISSIYARIKRLLEKDKEVKVTKTRYSQKNNRPPKKPFVIQNTFETPSTGNTRNDFSDVIPEDVSVKLELLSSEEIHLVEFKQEPLSDCPPSDSDSDTESLPIPELERMDVQRSNGVSTETEILLDEDEKEEEYGFHAILEYYKDFLSTTRMYPDKTVTTYKCNKCDYETKHQHEADSHTRCNDFECEYCSFETSKLSTLIKHTSEAHKESVENNDIPELTPFSM